MATSRGKMRHPHPPFDDLSLRIAVQEWLLSPVGAESKYGHISDWDTSRVCDMRGLFLGARTFDQPLRWDTRNVHAMSGMFFNATAFNQPLPWDTRNVRIMSEMFCGATAFNQPLVWNTHNVHEMTGMFCGATAFNQPLSWDMRNVQSMRNMFLNASAFNRLSTRGKRVNCRRISRTCPCPNVVGRRHRLPPATNRGREPNERDRRPGSGPNARVARAMGTSGTTSTGADGRRLRRLVWPMSAGLWRVLARALLGRVYQVSSSGVRWLLHTNANTQVPTLSRGLGRDAPLRVSRPKSTVRSLTQRNIPSLPTCFILNHTSHCGPFSPSCAT